MVNDLIDDPFVVFVNAVRGMQRVWDTHLQQPEKFEGRLAAMSSSWGYSLNPRSYWSRGFLELVERCEERIDAEQMLEGIKLCLRLEEVAGFGSTTMCHRLAPIFFDRYPSRDSELFVWIHDNIRNPYARFDRNGVVASSYAEWCIKERRQRAKHKQYLDQIEHDHQIRRELRAMREAENATKQLFKCVRRGDVRAVEAMLAKGADFGSVVSEHGSLQAVAIENGREAVLHYLIERGVP